VLIIRKHCCVEFTILSNTRLLLLYNNNKRTAIILVFDRVILSKWTVCLRINVKSPRTRNLSDNCDVPRYLKVEGTDGITRFSVQIPLFG
jgi:hypothetical protein